MKKNVLVTLADENYIDQAKQLFSSAYFNGEWDGDFLLLSHEIPDGKLEWFRKKGIHVKQCKPILKDRMYHHHHSVFSKFYLFEEDMKKWNNIVYIDADSIVMWQLDYLKKINGFNSLSFIPAKISGSFFEAVGRFTDARHDLDKEYGLEYDNFCSSFMAFNSNIIKKDSFNGLISLFNRYALISHYGDEGILNLFFYRNWKKLPLTYNVIPSLLMGDYGFSKSRVKGAVLHFMTRGDKYTKPWNSKNPFYNEWKKNLDNSEFIFDKKISKNSRTLFLKLHFYSFYYGLRYNIYRFGFFIDSCIGKLGIIIRKASPNLYGKIKALKR